jgi:3-deoxy-manno-octulosonate cytidylyltransferase (CMP-KDO synthetase)
MSFSFRVLIPARYQSTRLPGKPLLKYQGKTIIEHVYDRACESDASSVHVVTDDERIAEAVTKFGADVCMTSSDHQSGTDRISEAVDKIGYQDDEIIVNLQGDEPQMPAQNIKQVAQLLSTSQTASIATLYAKIHDIHDYLDPDVVKVVLAKHQQVLYFSRASIPFVRDEVITKAENYPLYKHIGLYAYRCAYLKQFVAYTQTSLEQLERLEQLRALENGDRIIADECQQMPGIAIDTDNDFQRLLASS